MNILNEESAHYIESIINAQTFANKNLILDIVFFRVSMKPF